MKSSWETHKGKKVFCVCYDHLTVRQLQAEMDEVEKEVFRQPPASVLLLVDTTGTIITPEALELFKNAASRSRQYTRKTAVLGVTGVRKLMLDIVVKFSGMKLVAMDDAQQARDWLVKD